MIGHFVAALLSTVRFVPSPCGTAPPTSIHGTAFLLKDTRGSGPSHAFSGTEVRLEPGYYGGDLDANGCHSSFIFVVLPGAARTIPVQMRPGFWMTTRDDANGLAGFVPRTVVRARLDPAEAYGRSYEVAVRNGAYYFDQQDGFGRFILNLTDASGATSRVGVDMHGVHWAFKRRDVSAAELLATRGVASPFHRPGLLARGVGDAMWVLDTPGNRVELVRRSGIVATFPLPTYDSVPTSIAVDRDGNAWVAESRANAVARISPAGIVREFSVPRDGTGTDPHLDGRIVPEQIILGHDGRMWCRMRLRATIAAFDGEGRMRLYPVAPHIDGKEDVWIQTIASGADGRIWFGGSGILGSIGADGSLRTIPYSAGLSGMIPAGDGVWATSWDSIVHIDPSGVVQEFPFPLGDAWPYTIALAGDGSLNLADRTGNVFGTVSEAGTFKLQYAMFLPAGIFSFANTAKGETSYAMSAQHTVVVGNAMVFVPGDPTYLEPDDVGDLWFSEPNANAVGYIAPNGHPRIFPLLNP